MKKTHVSVRKDKINKTKSNFRIIYTMELKTYTRKKTQTGSVAKDKLLIKKRDGRER